MTAQTAMQKPPDAERQAIHDCKTKYMEAKGTTDWDAIQESIGFRTNR